MPPGTTSWPLSRLPQPPWGLSHPLPASQSKERSQPILPCQAWDSLAISSSTAFCLLPVSPAAEARPPIQPPRRGHQGTPWGSLCSVHVGRGPQLLWQLGVASTLQPHFLTPSRGPSAPLSHHQLHTGTRLCPGTASSGDVSKALLTPWRAPQTPGTKQPLMHKFRVRPPTPDHRHVPVPCVLPSP